MSEEDDRLAALERHVQEFWDGHIVQEATWQSGPILERVPHFSTRRVLPKRAGEAWVYVTVGCSLPDSDGSDDARTEFFLMSPVASEAHSETLAMVSHFHSFEAHRLGIGSTINIGRPWMPDSPLDHLLVSLPYPYGPDLEWAPSEAGGARFLWLLPIHEREAAFVKRTSLEEFESLMDSAGANVLDPHRKPVV